MTGLPRSYRIVIGLCLIFAPILLLADAGIGLLLLNKDSGQTSDQP